MQQAAMGGATSDCLNRSLKVGGQDVLDAESSRPSLEPTSRFFYSQGLRLHWSDWGNDSAPPLLLLHGGRDHSRSWDEVALELRDHYHVIALDWRGHGDSEWAKGSSYALPDFVADLDAFWRTQKMASAKIVGHSMGGAIALQFAGVYPDRTEKLFIIEGLRISAPTEKAIHQRMAEWIEQMRDAEGRHKRRYHSFEDAMKRMREAHPKFSDAQVRHLTRHGLRSNDDGTVSWKYDDAIRLRTPYRLSFEHSADLWQRIICPTMLVRGTASGRPDPGTNGWIQYFSNATTAEVDDAGHWVHHDFPEKSIALIREFLES
jgi:pimeloyl-ACP methyl ester carboxylesterase